MSWVAFNVMLSVLEVKLDPDTKLKAPVRTTDTFPFPITCALSGPAVTSRMNTLPCVLLSTNLSVDKLRGTATLPKSVEALRSMLLAVKMMPLSRPMPVAAFSFNCDVMGC